MALHAMAGDREEDRELARRIAAGEEEAAAELMRRLGPELFAYARRILDDPHLAEDVLQDTFLGAFQTMERFDARHSSLRGWVFGILRHKVVDAVRRRGIRWTVSLDDPEEGGFREDGHWKTGQRFPVWDEHQEILQVVRECLDHLPHNQREAVILRSIRELSSQEAADVLGMPEPALRQLLHRARQALRRCVDGKMGGTA